MLVTEASVVVGCHRQLTYTPKMILSLLAYLAAMLLQREAKMSLEGPPWPMIYCADDACNMIRAWAGFYKIGTNLSVEASVVVNINDAASTSVQTSLDESIILCEVVFVNVATHGVVREELPADGKAEDVEAIVIDKMLHLSLAVVTVILQQWGPSTASSARSVGVATEVEPGNVHSCEAELSCASWWSAAGGCAGACASWCSTCAGGCRRGCGARNALGVV